MNTLLYLDAGLGAMIAQAAIAAAAGFILFYKTAIMTIKGWLGMNPKTDESSFDDVYDDADLKDE